MQLETLLLQLSSAISKELSKVDCLPFLLFQVRYIQSRIRRHVCVLFITKRILGPYSGASGAGRPKNGASRLRSYLGKESVSTYDPHIA